MHIRSATTAKGPEIDRKDGKGVESDPREEIMKEVGLCSLKLMGGGGENDNSLIQECEKLSPLFLQRTGHVQVR